MAGRRQVAELEPKRACLGQRNSGEWPPLDHGFVNTIDRTRAGLPVTGFCLPSLSSVTRRAAYCWSSLKWTNPSRLRSAFPVNPSTRAYVKKPCLIDELSIEYSRPSEEASTVTP